MILHPANRPTWVRHVVAILTVALAAVVRAGLLGSLGTRAPYVTFYPAVILAALFGGLPAGLLATLLSVLTITFWWVEPIGRFSIRDPADLLSAGVFVIGGSMISFITQAMQRANRRAMEAEAQVRLVTERSRVEQELRRYKLLAEHSRDIIMCVRLDDKRILEANEAAVKAYGYTRQELLELSVYDLRTSEGHPLVEGQVTEADTHSILFEAVHRRKDGSTFPVEVSSQGATIGGTRALISVIRDISNRKRAEAALRESERQFRTLANAIPQLCWMANADGRIFWYNERWYQYTGTSPEQMEGWGWQRVHDAEMLPKVLERWKLSIATGEPFDMVFPLLGADGEFRPFLTRVMPLRDRDSKVARWFGTNTDISEQRRVEEALASSDRKLRALLDSASQGVVAVDDRGRIVLVNAKTEEMFGYRREELLGQCMDVILPERHRATHGEALRHYFAHPYARAMGSGMDFRGRSKSGDEFPLEISLSCIDQGGSRLALALITDITERQKAEERLRQAQKMESLGILAGGVAHDFNNLLVGVIGNASLAQEMLPPDHPVAGLLDGVLKTGEQAAHLTRQMLAYSGKGHFVVEKLDLSALIPEMSALARSSIARKIALTLDLDAGLPAIAADRGQIQQVFMNLARNAAEAIGNHDGTISVRTRGQAVDDAYRRLHMEAAALRVGRYVCLEVRDTGCGMDEPTKARIFDPFFSTKFTGRGLGLAAVAGIVRGHKGAILVESAPGEGSRFTVLFPASEQVVEKPVEVRAGAAAPGSGVVLVVDDEPAVREMAKRSLELQGYTVLQAGSALAAIDVLKRHAGEIALVVLDLSMPDMSGAEALPELRKIRPELSVVVSSGYSEAETMTLFEGQHVAGFLQKPYTSNELAGKVKESLASNL